MNRIFHRFAALPLLGIWLAHAHPSGTSTTTIRLLDADSVTVEINAKHDDYIYVIHPKVGGNPDTVLPEEARFFEEKTAAYLNSHVTLQIDGQPLENLKIIRWKPNGKGPEDGFVNDKAAFWNGSCDITLGARLPKNRSKLEFTIQLFGELGLNPISEVSIYWHDTLLTQHWLGLDRNIRLSISPDSLAAALQRTKQPAGVQAARQENLVTRFITLGFTHILPNGMDHILFVLGLFFFSIRMRPLLWQITAFTIAHSITLGLAMLGVFSLSARIVEPLIALSIAVVGLENIFFRNVKTSRWLIVFGFGLIHGMGFASALRGLGLPQGKFWPVLVSFNAGVELGQLTVVTAAFVLTRWMWNKPWYFKRVVIPVSSLITLISLYWVVQRIFGF